ncbi:MAG: ABC transporter ATP-binding protein [Clostridia bacterium]|nr:ABC transporter ATP-binding protein [Clostridia bacterium]
MKNKKEKTPIFKKIRRTVSNNLYILRAVMRCTPAYAVLIMLQNVTNALFNVYGVYFTKRLFDLFETEGVTMGHILSLVIPYLIAGLVLAVIDYYLSYVVFPKQRETLRFKLHSELYRKAQSMDISCYDDPEFYNSFVWSMNTSDNEAAQVVDRLCSIAYLIISMAGIIGIVATIDPLVVLIIAICVTLSLVFKMLGTKLGVKQETDINPVKRRKEYSVRVFYLADYAKEIRTSRVAKKVLDEYGLAVDDEAGVIKKFAKRWVAIHIGQWTSVDSIQDMGITLLLVWKVMSNKISIGDYAAVTNSVWNLYWNMRQFIDAFSGFVESSMYVEKYRTFLEYENKIISGKRELPKFKSLKVSGLDFAYESNEENTLKGVDFEIKRGEKIAIVGYNGAGKTTLIKLLMRLYDPSKGRIEYNGRNIKDYKLDEYRNNFGTIFQDYKVFAATVAENVLGGEYTPDKEKAVLDALHRATFDDKLAELPNGIHSNLTREFDEEGVNLSGGEAQKIAIARAFARDCDLIIMDEPSSALDPISEYELNHSIKENSKDKTVIFISHRLSTTRMADRIYMFEDGRIVEQGSHDELMKQNGKYAYMFNLQAEKYKQ